MVNLVGPAAMQAKYDSPAKQPIIMDMFLLFFYLRIHNEIQQTVQVQSINMFCLHIVYQRFHSNCSSWMLKMKFTTSADGLHQKTHKNNF